VKPVRFALIGTGQIAAFHARAIALVPHAQLVAVHSRREPEGLAFAAKFGVAYESDLGALLCRDDVDAVCLTTPSGTHALLGTLAAQHGKHVLSEKPLDVSLDRVDELIAACEQNGVRMGAIFQPALDAARLPSKRRLTRGASAKWRGRALMFPGIEANLITNRRVGAERGNWMAVAP